MKTIYRLDSRLTNLGRYEKGTQAQSRLMFEREYLVDLMLLLKNYYAPYKAPNLSTDERLSVD